MSKRISILFVLLISAFCRQAFAQLVPYPRYSFEKVSLTDSVEAVRSMMGPPLGDSTDASGERILAYQDTIQGLPVRLSLGFHDRGLRLWIVALFYFGKSGDRAVPDSVKAQNIEILWNDFCTRYGPMSNQRTPLTFARSWTWLFSQSTVQMTKMHGTSEGLTITYRR